MADEKDMNAAEQEVADPLKNRDTNTTRLSKLDDTRTRKSIKLHPIESSPVSSVSDTLELVADPLNTRHTKTGALHKLEDTRTRKTIKFGAAIGKGSVAKPVETTPKVENEDTATAKLERPARQPGLPTLIPIPKPEETAAETAEFASESEGEDTSTARLVRPVRQPGLPTLIPIPEGSASKTAEFASESEGEDTSTARLVRPPRKIETPTMVPKAVPKVAPLPSAESTAVPASDRAAVTKSTGYTDTRTRRTIKMASVSAASPDAKTIELTADPTASRKLGIKDDTRTRKSIKLNPGATPELSAVQSAAESVMPTVAQAKAISPLSQTIKLRPSEAGSSAPVATAPSSRDTIKLKPSGASAPSAPALKLKPSEAPTSKPISLSTKSAAPQTAPPSDPGVVATSSASGDSDSQAPEAKNGLMLKKDIDTTRKGPPRAAKEEAEIKSGKKKRVSSGGPSWAYTSFCVLMLVCLLFTAFISAAHYFNTWQPELVKKHLGERIVVPILDDQIKNR